MEYLDKPQGFKSFKEYLENIKKSPFYYLVKNSSEFKKMEDKNKADYEEFLKDQGLSAEDDQKDAIRKYLQFSAAQN